MAGDFNNYIRCALAIKHTRAGILGFVENEIETLHQDILQNVIQRNNLAAGTTCTACSTPNVLPCPTALGDICRLKRHICSYHNGEQNTTRKCRRNICGDLKLEIEREHRYNKPSWKNTDATKWCSNAWQVAKCYMPPDGFQCKQSAKETDFNGILNVMINCKRFQTQFADDLSRSKNICLEAREVGRDVRHTAEFEFSDVDRERIIDVLQRLLDDPKHLRSDEKASHARRELDQLKGEHIPITSTDVSYVTEQSIQSATENVYESLIPRKTILVDEAVMSTKKEVRHALVGDLKDVMNKTIREFVASCQQNAAYKLDQFKEQLINDDLIQNYIRKAVEETVKLTQENLDEKMELCINTKLEQADVSIRGRLTLLKENDPSESMNEVIQSERRKMLKEIIACIKETMAKATNTVIEEMNADIGKYKQDSIEKGVDSARRKMEMMPYAQYREEIQSRVKDWLNSDGASADSYETKKCEFKKDLVTLYQTELKTLPLKPIAGEGNESLNELYMPPEMTFGDCEKTQAYNSNNVRRGKETKSYRDMFYLNNERLLNIYVVGEPGTGKTTFCSRMALLWSQFEQESSAEQLRESKHDDNFTDTTTLAEFDFLFFLALKESSETYCQIENMIETQIVKPMGESKRYDLNFVKNILAKEKCLILLDGLDEWIHSDRCPLRQHKNATPHRTHANGTYMTTTRLWKFKRARSNDSEIDATFEINGISNIQTFAGNIIQILNEKHTTSRNERKFINDISNEQLNHFKQSPLVLLQIIRIWHNSLSLPTSKGEIYRNITEMLLAGEHFNLSALCVLAYDAFHRPDRIPRECSLVFDIETVERSLPQNERKAALDLGILKIRNSCNKDLPPTYCFLHKSFQEYFAAKYIATTTDIDTTMDELFKVYGQSVHITNISHIFEFLCGMNPEMATKLSQSIMDYTSRQLQGQLYNVNSHKIDRFEYYNNAKETVMGAQQMVVDGLKEAFANNEANIQLCLTNTFVCDQIFSDDYWKCLRHLWQLNENRIETFWQSGLIKGLDKLSIQDMINKSSSSLKTVASDGHQGESLDLSACINVEHFSLFDGKNTDLNVKLDNLVACSLANIPSVVEESHILCELNNYAKRLSVLQVHHVSNTNRLCQLLLDLHNLQRVSIYQTVFADDQSIHMPQSIEFIHFCNVNMSAKSFSMLKESMAGKPQRVECHMKTCNVTPEGTFKQIKDSMSKASDSFVVLRDDEIAFVFFSKPKPIPEHLQICEHAQTCPCKCRLM